MDKGHSIQKQMGNVNTERESLGKNQKEMLEMKTNTNKQTNKTKNIVPEMKSAFEMFISKLDMAKERSFEEIEDFKIETSKTEKQRENRL